MKSINLWCLAALSATFVGACSREEAVPSTQPTTESPFHIIASVEELMDAEVDPAADALWDSVAIVTNSTGTQYRQPRTAEEWDAVRHSALTLSEATNLLVMAGRPVAAAKGARARAPEELSAAQIQQHIASDPATFGQFARSLQLAALNALKTIDARDAAGLMDAGSTIDGACEACHVVYWYPNLKSPQKP